MKFSLALIAAASLYLLPFTGAQDDATVDDVTPDADEPDFDIPPPPEVSAAPPVDPAILANISRPIFAPTILKGVPFLEQFTDDWERRWKVSKAKKQVKAGEDEWSFVGTWSVEEPNVFKAIEGDKGLVVKNEAAHHGISSNFPKVIDNKGKTLVVQYEVKFQDGLECGGAYMKLLKEQKSLHSDEFSNATPYVIMFGPDKCGSTNKVHFIFKHKNPKTGEYEEKHLDDDVTAKVEKTSTLYTLIVRPDNSFQIKIDGKEEAKGNLLESFDPPVNPPKEIDDPDDKKPEDWVENAKMADPEAKKPEDWDEDAPYQIVDEEAEKPADWLDDEPKLIPDPDAKKPEDWNDEEDGDWEPQLIPNPKCSEVSGCGEWEKPMKNNPDYKGKWAAPMIDNPDYKGEWKPRKIPNKDYYEDKNPSNFEPIGGLGFELWTMQANILFDNIYIGHSEAEAESFKKETFDKKKPLEEKMEEAVDKGDDDDSGISEPSLIDTDFKENPILYIRQGLTVFINLLKEDPKKAVTELPQIAGGVGVVLVTVLALIFGSLGLGAQSPAVQEQAKKAKDKAVEAKDKAADAAASGIDKASDVTKRATRSSEK